LFEFGKTENACSMEFLKIAALPRIIFNPQSSKNCFFFFSIWTELQNKDRAIDRRYLFMNLSHLFHDLKQILLDGNETYINKACAKYTFS
jgi:hypothetical protein